MRPEQRHDTEQTLNETYGIVPLNKIQKAKNVYKKTREAVHSARELLGTPTDVELTEKLTTEAGIKDVVWVPCSITDTIQDLMVKKDKRGEINYHQMVNEHSLAGVAAGIYLATGKPALIHMQNSGLSNAADGITSFAKVYKIPMPTVVTYRGNDMKDDSEPHQEIGKITAKLTNIVFDGKVHGDRLGRGILKAADRMMEDTREGKPSALRLAPQAFRKVHPLRLSEVEFDTEEYEQNYKNTVEKHGQGSNPINSEERLERDESLKMIHEVCVKLFGPDYAGVYSNGFNARAAQGAIDRLGNFYNVGYMGGSLAVGWGMAKANPDLNVVVVDGDQNAMMGKMHEILASDYPDNLQWIIADNRHGTSVGVARSPMLPRWYSELAWIVNTIPEPPKTFKHPRVGKRGAYYDDDIAYMESKLGPLEYHADRYKDWAVSTSAAKRVEREFNEKFANSRFTTPPYLA